MMMFTSAVKYQVMNVRNGGTSSIMKHCNVFDNLLELRVDVNSLNAKVAINLSVFDHFVGLGLKGLKINVLIPEII